jgi:hypothetical protein
MSGPSGGGVSPEQPYHAEEMPLPAGRMTHGVVRRGGQLLRPMGPWSVAVHEYLRHLESAGFPGAPRVLGIDREREILTFIDGAGPVDPLVDLAAAAWAFVPLAPPERLREAGFDPVPNIGARLRLFLDAYGVPNRRSVLPALQGCLLLAAERVKYAPVAAAEAAEALEFHAQELRWLHSNLSHLDRELAP